MKKNRSRQEWHEIILDYRQSGMSQSKYAKTNGLNLHTFQTWIRAFSIYLEFSESNFLELQWSQSPPSPLTVVLPNQIQIVIPSEFDSQHLRQVTEALM